MQTQAELATQESKELEGHVALVTGSGRGIGKAVALKLASMGANIVVNYNASGDLAQGVVEEIKGLGVESASFQADVSQTDQVEAMVNGAVDTFGKVDILVNNSGIIRDKLLLRMTDDDWDTVIGTDLRGAFPLHARCHPFNDARALGTHHQYFLSRRARRQPRPIQLCRCQVRPDRIHIQRSQGVGGQKRHGQHRRSRLHLHRCYRESAGGDQAAADRPHPARATRACVGNR